MANKFVFTYFRGRSLDPIKMETHSLDSLIHILTSTFITPVSLEIKTRDAYVLLHLEDQIYQDLNDDPDTYADPNYLFDNLSITEV